MADGLNGMLAGSSRRASVLQERVREATGELLARNAELEESYQRVLGLQEALARAERMAAVGEMAGSVAHQVGTPLNLVSGYVQMIREDPQTHAGVRQRLEIVEAQLAQVTRVLRTMLDEAQQSPRGSRRVLERSSNARARSPDRASLARVCTLTFGCKRRCPMSMPMPLSSSWRSWTSSPMQSTP